MKDKFVFDRRKCFSYHDGVRINDRTINEWIKRAVASAKEQLRKHPDMTKSFESISSGNTKVIVEIYRQINNKYTIFVSVCDGYWEMVELDNDIK